jgi:5'-nucleotidase
LVDTGDFFWPQELGKLRAEITVKALRPMKHDALNIADGELSYGIDFLSEIYTEFKHQFLSSNIIKDGSCLYQPYIIKIYNDLKIAVLGAVSPRLVDNVQIKEDAILVENPLNALNGLIPDIRKKVDLVLLLSHLGWKNTVELVEKISGIDVAIVGHDYYKTFEPNQINDTLILKNSVGGKHVGVVKIWVDESKKIKNIESSLEKLSDKIHIYPEYTLPETEFEKKKAEELNKKKEGVKKHAKIIENFKDWTKLTPEEFVQKMKETGGTFETKP